MIFSGLLFLTLTTRCSCEKDEGGFPNDVMVKVILINMTDTDVHLFISDAEARYGESLDPSNKVAPYASRVGQTQLWIPDYDGYAILRCYAYRNGQQIGEFDYQFKGTDYCWCSDYTIRYTGTSMAWESTCRPDNF